MQLLSFAYSNNGGPVPWFTTGILATCVAAATACVTSQQLVRGTVTAVTPNSIEIRHKSGQVVPVALQPTTAFRWDHTAASRDDLQVGSRVLVLFQERTGPFVATEVRIFTRPIRPNRGQSRLIDPKVLAFQE